MGNRGARNIEQQLYTPLSTIRAHEATSEIGKRKCPTPSADQCFHTQRRLKAAGIYFYDASMVAAGASHADAPTGAVCIS